MPSGSEKKDLVLPVRHGKMERVYFSGTDEGFDSGCNR